MAIDNPSNIMPDQEIIIEGDAGFVPKASPEDTGKVLGVLNSSGDVGWVIDQSGTFTQIQANWAETDPSQVSYIDNKPDLSVYATTSAMNTALAGKQDTISDLSDIRAGAAKGDTAVQPGDLATVATSGSYSDLTNTPDLSIYAEASDLATVATTGSYDDLLNKPTIPAAQVNSDWNSISGVSQILNKPSLAAVATTGDYDDLVNKPSIPAAQVNSDWNAVSGVSQILNKPTIPSGDELVPSATSVDSGKVLTVDSQGSPAWVTPSGGTTYTAGDGIDITNDTISADVDGSTIGIDSTTKKIKLLSTIPTVDQTYDASSTNAMSGVAVAQAIGQSTTLVGGDGITLTESNNQLTIDADVDNTTIGIDATTKKIKLLATIPTVDQTYDATSANAQSGVAVASAISAISVDEVPAVTSSDDGKVLQATYSGGTGSYSWETAPTPASKPLVGGNCITVTENTNDVSVAFTTTAGITDIQLVNALPASPVATVLYIIPST